MLLEHLELSTRGKWAEGYGRVFRLYVEDKVRKANLPVKNHGGRKIEISKHPGIEPWLNKLKKERRFQVDRFIQREDLLFVISCKARDFLYDRKIRRRDFFFSIRAVEARIRQDIEDMGEIFIETDCIASCDRVRKDLELDGSMFVPIVLTSRLEPMGVKEVRDYYSDKLKFPDVPMLMIEDFIEILRDPRKKIADGTLLYL